MARLGFTVVPAVSALSGATHAWPAAPPTCTTAATASHFLGRRDIGRVRLLPVTRPAITRRRSIATVLSVGPAGGGDEPIQPPAFPDVAPCRVGRAGEGRPWRQWAAATMAALALVISPGAARAARRSMKTKEAPAPAPAEAVRYDGKKQLAENERAVSLVITGGAFAGLFGWAYLSNRRDDQEESVRVREEVERLEKIKQEFVEVDGDDSAPDDADMMAELRKRLAAEAAAGSDPTDATATDDPDAPPTPPPVAGSDKS